MSPLQWALLLLGAGIVVLLLWSSRREKKARERLNPPAPTPVSRDYGMTRETPEPADRSRPTAATPRSSGAAGPAGEFDELGVGRPRSARRAPELGPAPAAAAAPAPAARPPGKVIGLYIAEHEGTNILGPKIHAALRDRGLRYGDKRIYHRYEGESAVFSVASLVKPGALDPAESEGFATPGLSVFMVLPGPRQPVAAFQEMLDTARGLARALNAELFDSEQHAPLTLERERTLHQQVEDWAQRHGRAAQPTA